MKKCTFDDWWNGKVYLNTCTAVFAKGVEPIPCTTWEDFSNDDIGKIKAKQREIFEKEKNFRVEWFKGQCLERYSKSEMKREFLNEEILKCEDIMFCDLSKSKFHEFEKWNLSFETKSLLYIKQYIENTIKRGIPYNFESVHSLNFKFHDATLFNSSVYAQAIWEHHKWLKNIVIKPKVLIDDPEKNYSLTAIAIAYCVMDITISSQNAAGILLKHSQHRSSNKLLQKRVNRKGDLLLTSENKSTDTKHKNALEEAQRLLSGMKMKKEVEAITLIINEFKANRNKDT